MKSSTMFALFGVVGGWISLSEPLHAQSQARQSSAQAVAQVRALSRLEQSLKASGSEGKFTFIVFSKEDNAAAREMLGVVKQVLRNVMNRLLWSQLARMIRLSSL